MVTSSLTTVLDTSQTVALYVVTTYDNLLNIIISKYINHLSIQDVAWIP